MQFLIDEYLSARLQQLLVRVDFCNPRTSRGSAYDRERTHPGLACINVAHGLMSLNVQQARFENALRYIANENIEGQVVEHLSWPKERFA